MIDHLDECGALRIGADGQSGEGFVNPEADVNEEPRRIFVEVQEGLRSPVEHARPLLDQSVEGPKSFQQRRQFTKRRLRGVLHQWRA